MGNLINEIKNNVEVVSDNSQLATAALHYFFNKAAKAIREKGVFNVAISGGRSPVTFYKELPLAEVPEGFDWQKIQLFWVDERCVSPYSADSNYRLAMDTFLSKIPIPRKNVHRVIGEMADYKVAVREYEVLIREHFKIKSGEFPVFDLICLGVGADGHIASLFPNNYALCDNQDIVAVVYLMGDKSMNRITLTIPVLQNASNLLVLITGSRKAEIVRQIFQSEPDEIRYPVHNLWPVLDKVHWIVDEKAAKSLNVNLPHFSY